MSASDDSTRPLSVAELLARNGTIGSPPVGRRRRRKRRNSDGVSVSELTGEIPVVRTGEIPVVGDEDEYEYYDESEDDDGQESDYEYEYEESVVEESVAEESVAEESVVEESVAEESIYVESAEQEPVYQEPDYALPESSETVVVYVSGELADQGHAAEIVEYAAPEIEYVETEYVTEYVTEEPAVQEVLEEVAVEDVAVEEVAAEPLVVHDVVTEAAPVPLPLANDPLPHREASPERSHDPRPQRRSSGAEQMAYDPVDQAVDLAGLVDEDADQLRSYLNASQDTLFSGETVADDLARGGVPAEAAAASVPAPPRRLASTLWNSVLAVLQSLLAVVVGAGLFIGFDQLWRWNNLVALILSVLVVLSLAAGVRWVRKTEDIVSTLTAVAVGLLVTLGPLALQST